MIPLRIPGLLALALILWAAVPSAARSQADTAGGIHPDEASEALTEDCVDSLKHAGLDRMAAKSECSGRMETMTTLPRASDAQIRQLSDLPGVQSTACGEIHYAFQCISGLPRFLDKWGCRVGETQAECCGRALAGLGDFCGRIWAIAQRAGRSWPRGLFVCRCTQEAGPAPRGPVPRYSRQPYRP